MDKTITFSANNISIEDALIQISKLSDTDIAFSNRFFKKQKTVNLSFEQTPLHSVLQAILQPTTIDFKLVGKRILLYKKKIPQYTISGYIQDKNTGERLIAATVHCPTLQKGTVTNEYGFFSITLPGGLVELGISYIGYEPQYLTIQLKKNSHQVIQLQHSITLAEVVVSPKNISPNNTNTQTSYDYSILDEASANYSPQLGGVADPIRIAQLNAGIQIGADELGGIAVRGGDSDQNLMLLDGVPVYIPYHLLGLFSIYNQLAIKSTKIFKGSFPAKYGGSLSSVFDIRTKEGNQFEWKAIANTNLITTNALIEGPIKKGKGALLLTGRYAHSDFLLNPFFSATYFDADPEALNNTFFDFNIKAHYTLSSRDRLFASFYIGADDMTGSNIVEEEVFEEEEEIRLSWSNNIAALRWNHLFNDQLFSNTILTYSWFDHEYALLNTFFLEDTDKAFEKFDYLSLYSDNTDIGLKIDFDYLPSPQHHFRFGGGFSFKTFLPEISYFTGDETFFEATEEITFDGFKEFRDSDVFEALEGYLYLEDQLQITPAWRINLGLRASSFFTESKVYARLEPRITTTYHLNRQIALTASFSRMIQYLHLISFTNIRLPNDLWVPSDEAFAPQESRQGELGIQYTPSATTVISVDAYYKKLKNLYTYSSDFDFTNTNFQDFLIKGGGEAMGIEFSLQHKGAKNGGQLTYAFTKSTRQFDQLHSGASFPHLKDQPHQVKLFAYQRLGKNLTIGANWVFYSAAPATEIISLNNIDLLGNNFEETTPPFTLPDRLGDYHRLDIDLSYQRTSHKLVHIVKIGAYNVYNRKNQTYFRLQFSPETAIGYQPVYGLSFRPTLSYQIKF